MCFRNQQEEEDADGIDWIGVDDVDCNRDATKGREQPVRRGQLGADDGNAEKDAHQSAGTPVVQAHRSHPEPDARAGADDASAAAPASHAASEGGQGAGRLRQRRQEDPAQQQQQSLGGQRPAVDERRPGDAGDRAGGPPAGDEPRRLAGERLAAETSQKAQLGG